MKIMMAYITKQPQLIREDKHNVIHYELGGIHYGLSAGIYATEGIQRIPIGLLKTKMNHQKAVWYYPDSASEAHKIVDKQWQEYREYLLSPATTPGDQGEFGDIIGEDKKVGKTLIDVAQHRQRQQGWRSGRL